MYLLEIPALIKPIVEKPSRRLDARNCGATQVNRRRMAPLAQAEGTEGGRDRTEKTIKLEVAIFTRPPYAPMRGKRRECGGKKFKKFWTTE